MGILFTPFSVALDSSNDDISILVGDTDFGAIRWPFHIFDVGGFSIVDHLLDPLSLIFHENDYCTGGITGC